MRATMRTAGGARRPREVTGRIVLIWLVAFFAVVGAVNAIMVRAAVSTFGGLETESSYKTGLNFASEIEKSEAQEARHWIVSVHVGAIVDGEVSIELAAIDAGQRPLAGYDASAQLAHPTNRRLDRSIELTPSGPGRFLGRIQAEPGQRDLIVEIARSGDRLFLSRERVTLQAAKKP